MGGWKARHIALPGRVELVRATLSAMIIFQLMVLDPPMWLLKKVNKLLRGFLWAQDEEATASKCLVNWSAVSRPREFDGLGILDIQKQGRALRCRWQWYYWTDPTRPWHTLPLPADPSADGLFRASTTIVVGNGRLTSFWDSHWANAMLPVNRWPELLCHCTKRRLSLREAVTGNRWMRLLKPNPSSLVLRQLCSLTELASGINFNDSVADHVIWRWAVDGTYAAKSAY